MYTLYIRDSAIVLPSGPSSGRKISSLHLMKSNLRDQERLYKLYSFTYKYSAYTYLYSLYTHKLKESLRMSFQNFLLIKRNHIWDINPTSSKHIKVGPKARGPISFFWYQFLSAFPALKYPMFVFAYIRIPKFPCSDKSYYLCLISSISKSLPLCYVDYLWKVLQALVKRKECICSFLWHTVSNKKNNI